MLLSSRVAGRTLGLRGPDLARGPEVARRSSKCIIFRMRRGNCVRGENEAMTSLHAVDDVTFQ